MANNIADNITESFQNIFLAGVGALSIGSEKAKEVLDDLVARGKVTVEEGRKINEELKHKAVDSTNKFHEESVRAYVKSLSSEDRAKFADSMAALAREIDEEEARQAEELAAEAEEVAEAAESTDAE